MWFYKEFQQLNNIAFGYGFWNDIQKQRINDLWNIYSRLLNNVLCLLAMPMWNFEIRIEMKVNNNNVVWIYANNTYRQSYSIQMLNYSYNQYLRRQNIFW